VNAFLIAALSIGGFLLLVFKYIRKKQNTPRFSPFTENFLRDPGETLREQRDKLLQDLLEPVALSIGLLCSIPFVVLSSSRPTKLILAGTILLVFIYQIRKAKNILDKAMKVRLGWEGERATGQELSLLMRDGAWVFHDLPYKYGNIDHVVIGAGGVFAIETKAVSKPASATTGRPEAAVEYNGNSLKFPYNEVTEPLVQARRHAKYLHQHIKEKLNIDTAVRPVVALPGWFVQWTGGSDVMVVNPKRGHYLKKELSKEVLKSGDVALIAGHFESVARSVRPGSKKLDPNAAEHYDFWMNPRYKPPSVD